MVKAAAAAMQGQLAIVKVRRRFPTPGSAEGDGVVLVLAPVPVLEGAALVLHCVHGVLGRWR
jgi:hypothetical protein